MSSKNIHIIYKLNYLVFKHVSGSLQRTDHDQRRNLSKQVYFLKFRFIFFIIIVFAAAKLEVGFSDLRYCSLKIYVQVCIWQTCRFLWMDYEVRLQGIKKVMEVKWFKNLHGRGDLSLWISRLKLTQICRKLSSYPSTKASSFFLSELWLHCSDGGKHIPSYASCSS